MMSRVSRISQSNNLEPTHENRIGARRVIQLINRTPGAPDFLSDAMLQALHRAARIKKIQILTADDRGDLIEDALAKLFANSELLD